MIDSAQRQILAILFASGDAVEIDRIAGALSVDEDTIIKYIPLVRDALQDSGMPFELLRLEDKLQLATLPEFAPVIRSALELRRNIPLSQAALEVLAVVAYNQPVTRGFIEQVRGVDSSGVVSSLVEKGLIEEAERLELPGRPIAFRTTANFLRCFSIQSLEELPPLPESGEIVLEEDEPEDSSELPLEGQVSFSEMEPDFVDVEL